MLFTAARALSFCVPGCSAAGCARSTVYCCIAPGGPSAVRYTPASQRARSVSFHAAASTDLCRRVALALLAARVLHSPCRPRRCLGTPGCREEGSGCFPLLCVPVCACAHARVGASASPLHSKLWWERRACCAKPGVYSNRPQTHRARDELTVAGRAYLGGCKDSREPSSPGWAAVPQRAAVAYRAAAERHSMHEGSLTRRPVSLCLPSHAAHSQRTNPLRHARAMKRTPHTRRPAIFLPRDDGMQSMPSRRITHSAPCAPTTCPSWWQSRLPPAQAIHKGAESAGLPRCAGSLAPRMPSCGLRAVSAAGCSRN